jgi:hypothetical protein
MQRLFFYDPPVLKTKAPPYSGTMASHTGSGIFSAAKGVINSTSKAYDSAKGVYTTAVGALSCVALLQVLAEIANDIQDPEVKEQVARLADWDKLHHTLPLFVSLVKIAFTKGDIGPKLKKLSGRYRDYDVPALTMTVEYLQDKKKDPNLKKCVDNLKKLLTKGEKKP